MVSLWKSPISTSSADHSSAWGSGRESRTQTHAAADAMCCAAETALLMLSLKQRGVCSKSEASPLIKMSYFSYSNSLEISC